MSIDLRKFVDIDIKQKVNSVISGTRDVTVIFTSYGTKNATYPRADSADNLLFNLAEAEERYGDKVGSSTLMSYIETYFEHGGAKLAIYEGYSSVTSDDISNLPDEYINVCFTDLTYDEIKALAIARQNNSKIYGIKEKILFASVNSNSDSVKVSNFAVKLSSDVGAEMTMPAYLSKINVYDIDTVFDYAFTQEHIPESKLNGGSLTNSEFVTAMNNNINVDVYLANAVRVCGGNCKDGVELTNNFVRIILHQTVTDRLVELLAQKIKSNSGLGKIYSTIAQELTYYLSCGYLTTDKIWLKDDLTVSVNGKSYTLIEKGTALTNGYVLKVLPLTSLSEEDKKEHKSPKIYLIIADQYAIRKITINGEVV